MTGLRINHFIVQLLLSVILLATQGSAYLFQPVVASCIYWDLLSTHQANDDPYKIHCIQDENGLPGIVNTTWKVLQAGYCPYYDRHGKSINIRTCNSAAGKCPTNIIFSYEAVRYAGCYSSPTPSINYSLEIGSTVTTREPNTEACTCYCTEGFIGIIAIASTFFIIIMAAIILRFQVHKKMSKRTYSERYFERKKSQSLTKHSTEDRTSRKNEENPSSLACNDDENEAFLHCNMEQLIGSTQIPNNDRLRRSSIRIIECNTANQSFQGTLSGDKDHRHTMACPHCTPILG